MRLIDDIGAHNGDYIPHYLFKGHLVVAVEPDRTLAETIKDQHPARSYIHRTEHVLS
jgi:hypothetical protein